MKRIVIIGGMGPQASLELHRRIIERAAQNGARDGSDFPSIVHFSLPIDDFISDQNKTKHALCMIIGALKKFEFRSDDTVVIACNTAHLLKRDLETALNIKITSLIDLTVAFVVANHSQISLLGSPTTIKSSLYTKPLCDAGIDVFLPSSRQLGEIESTIRAVIASEKPKPLETSQTPVLLACTELSCVFGGLPGTVDPMNIFIDTVMPIKRKSHLVL